MECFIISYCRPVGTTAHIRSVRVTDLSLLKQCAAEMSQSEERIEAPQYKFPEKWRLTCHGHSPSTELSPPTMRSLPVEEPTFLVGEGRPQAGEHIVISGLVILVIFFCFKYKGVCACAWSKKPAAVSEGSHGNTVVKIQDRQDYYHSYYCYCYCHRHH